MFEIETDNERTILDYLNEGCWRALLQYLPVKDLIRTESTSRRWQGLVLQHLQKVRITVDEYRYEKDKKLNTCFIKGDRFYESFERWIKKLGASVVAIYCNGLETLAILKENCPNIETLKLKHVQSLTPKQLRQYNLRDNYFKFLQRLCLDSCSMPDSYVSQFVADKALVGLRLYNCDSVTGLCFKRMNLSNLRFLEIEMCDNMKSKHILLAFNRLGELTKLKMHSISGDFFHEIQCGLDKMPKLEELYLTESEVLRGDCSHQLSQLTRLKHLTLAYQLFDEDIEAVTQSCQELVTLDLEDCRMMTRRSVKLLWRNAGARLTSLKISQFYYATDDDIVKLIRGCPHLTLLMMAGSGQLTRKLPARAAAARRAVAPGRELDLDLSFTNLAGNCFLLNVDGPYPEVLRKKYKGLNIIFLEDFFH